MNCIKIYNNLKSSKIFFTLQIRKKICNWNVYEEKNI